MKISHRDLEVARRSPRRYLKQRSSPHVFGVSAFRLWQYAIRIFHRPKHGVQEALAYLDGAFDAKFKVGPARDKRRREYSQHLIEYASDFQLLGHTTVSCGTRVTMDLGYNITLSGEVGRIDLGHQDDYSIYLLLKERHDWIGELRMPLLQAYFANEFNVDPGYVAVGIYALSSGKHEERQYPQSDIRRAIAEAGKIARNLNRGVASREARHLRNA